MKIISMTLHQKLATGGSVINLKKGVQVATCNHPPTPFIAMNSFARLTFPCSLLHTGGHARLPLLHCVVLDLHRLQSP